MKPSSAQLAYYLISIQIPDSWPTKQSWAGLTHWQSYSLLPCFNKIWGFWDWNLEGRNWRLLPAECLLYRLLNEASFSTHALLGTFNVQRLLHFFFLFFLVFTRELRPKMAQYMHVVRLLWRCGRSGCDLPFCSCSLLVHPNPFIHGPKRLMALGGICFFFFFLDFNLTTNRCQKPGLVNPWGSPHDWCRVRHSYWSTSVSMSLAEIFT